MKAIRIEIKDKVDALLACLDKEIQHLQEGLSQFDELRRSVIKHDDEALGKLLEKIQQDVENHKRLERNRQSIRQELAAGLGCGLKRMTLTTLETMLPKEKKDQVTRRKETIRTLIKQFRREHLSTTILLSECARFNKMLLKNIFNLSKAESLLYNSNGVAKRQTDAALINLQL
jgi:hypothetical protein